MKIPRVLKFFAFVLVLLALRFTLSSKCGGDFTDPPDPTCADHDTDITATIVFDMEQDEGYYNIPHRVSGMDNFIPDNDIRVGYQFPDPSLSTTNTSYYGVVVISSPDCPAWGQKYYRITTNNGANHVIEVSIPSPTWMVDLRIEVIYYEKIGDYSYMEGGDYTLEYYYNHVYSMNYQDTFIIELYYNDYIYAYDLIDPYDPDNAGDPVGELFDDIDEL